MTGSAEIVALSRSDQFDFHCGPEVACYNQCCRDLSQALTPYDVLRLRRRLGMTSPAFLERFTLWFTGPETGLPVVSLKPVDALTRACPFVTPSGCGVYPDRPSSCRMYPVFRGAARHRETGRISERFLLIREPHCRGFDQGRKYSVDQWIAGQGMELYNLANDEMLALISAKNRNMPGLPDDATLHWIYTACYDIDRFAEAIRAGTIPFGPENGMAEQLAAAADDLDLLRLGMAFVRHSIFKETPGADHGIN